ncbi:MAG: hypothetical protein IT385_08225 [Deltaproteobacteria bacterium]|nr:hypothetical protein [Deltaproteobacteria bacterium]
MLISPRTRRASTIAGALLAALVASARAEPTASPGAEPAPEATHGDYFGAFWGVELRGGVALRSADDTITPIPDLGFGLRVATLVSLVDVELGVETRGLVRERHDVRRTSIAGELRLHPMFIRLLQGDLASQIMGSLHLALGLGLEIMATSPDGDRPPPVDPDDATRFALGLRVGLGVEAPLTDTARAPWSLWLGLAWRMTVTGFSGAPRGLGDWDQHTLWLSLSLRFHDITFMRVPRPPELRDDD